MNSDLARVALLLRSLNAISMVGGFNPICLSQSTYPTDALTMPTCNTDKLVLAWDIKQPVYEMGLQYTCINPSGVIIDSPTVSLSNVLIGTGSTTLRGVATTPNSTCSLSACYFLNAIPATQRFFVLPTSCVVQLPPPTSTSYLIAPTTPGDRSTSKALESHQIVFYTPVTQIQHSQLMSPDNQGSYELISPSTLTSASASFILTTVTRVMHVDMKPSYADITPTHVYTTASNVDITTFNLYNTPAGLKTTCASFWCIPGYIAISIMATVSFILFLFIVAVVSRFIIRHKIALKRSHDLQLLGCTNNEKIDPDFRPTLTSLHAAFFSVESQLDSLHQLSSLAAEVKGTDCSLPSSDGYWSESVCDAEEMHQTNTSSSTC